VSAIETSVVSSPDRTGISALELIPNQQTTKHMRMRTVCWWG